MSDKSFVIVAPNGEPIGWDFTNQRLLFDGTETIFDTEAQAAQVLRKIIPSGKYRIEISEMDEVDDE